MTTKRITKRQADYFRGNVPGILAMLYNNIVGHVGYDISEDEIIEAFVPENDKDFVRNRSKDAYSHLNRSYYMRDAEIEVRGAGTPTVKVDFSAVTTFVAPAYMKGHRRLETLPEGMRKTIETYIEEVQPIAEMYQAAREAWDMVSMRCDNNLSQMVAMWPAIKSLANYNDFEMDKLTPARTLRAATPEIREKITTGTTFINMAMLAGKRVEVPHRSVGLSIV